MVEFVLVRHLFGQTVVDSVSQSLETHLSFDQVLLALRLDCGLQLAHEISHREFCVISQSDATLVGRLNILDGFVVVALE